jgi:hypothetical protein
MSAQGQEPEADRLIGKDGERRTLVASRHLPGCRSQTDAVDRGSYGLA